MAKIPVRVDPVPTLISGPRSISCECGYEAIWVFPEEIDSMLSSLLEHIQQHGIMLPAITVRIH